MTRKDTVHKFVFCALALCLLSASLVAQTATGSLKGTVTDPSGAVVPDATVTATNAAGQIVSATTNKQGAFEFKGLAVGKYTLDASGKGFSLRDLPEVDIAADRVVLRDIKFDIAVQQEKVNVEDTSSAVDVSPSSNVGAIVLKGKDLDALSDDPDQLQSDLQALAGPAAGPNGGQIYIDGFTGGQLPPKSSIREIRINQNPFSAQFDRLGFGRIEVFTKPGTEKYHGQFSFNENSSHLNSRNPFAASEPDYHSEQYSENIGGPINKKSSFNFSVERRNINEASVINAFILSPTNTQVPFTGAVLNPRTRTNITPRADFQLSPGNTLTTRYQFIKADETNNGIGNLSLASQGVDNSSIEHQFQISDTQIINPTTINETRFQYEGNRNHSTAQNLGATINVIGAFTGGGNRSGVSSVDINRYEFQNYTSMNRGKHFIKFGARLRSTQQASNSTAGYNGTFTFTSLDNFLNNLPSQFSITSGQPLAENTAVDVGLYAEDDWRVRPNLTVSYGLRYETQNNIGDRADIAPRIGFSWGLGSSKSTPKTVLRAGYGIFYDRFGQDLVLQAQRLNGTSQQQFVVNNPSCYPNVAVCTTLPGAIVSPTVYAIAPQLRAPYMLQAALTLERQLTKASTLSLTYTNSRGVHALDARNINAPLPGTYNPAVPSSGVRPNGTSTNIYQYESEGTFRQNQFIANTSFRFNTKVSLFANYVLGFANGDSSGAGSFPSNQYNLAADYGRTAFDIRHRFVIIGSVTLPYGFRLNPFVTVQSGAPYNITTGQDLNGDSIFNDRPAFATNTALATVKTTPVGTFDTVPTAGQTIIPVNYGNGPSQVFVNMRVSKSFGLGPKVERAAGQSGGGGGDRGSGGGGGGERGGPGGGGLARGGPGGAMGGIFGPGAVNRKYSLTFSANARNMFNHVNPATPIGNLSSPLFGISNSLAGGGFGGGSQAANRRIDMQVQFSF
ncbi:MAG: Oar protein [Acidobacteriales bacterium]|nr:Oar protein [Terriglobales bacterium]